ncbi:MAG: VanZ family protein [Marinifilaceae bacterium]|jgi:VanZ family protein|nr:VanZ family protein [Marinifilaceae bacterium]
MTHLLKNIKGKVLLNLILTVAWLIVIYILCLRSSSSFPQEISIPYLDKIAHFGLFFILALTIYINLYKIVSFKIILIFSVLNSMFHGAITEIMQANMNNGRTGDLFDLCFDILGGLSAVMIAQFIYKKKAFDLF